MPPDPEITLREFMEVRLDGMEDKFDRRFKALERKVDSLEQKVESLEHCISNDIKHAIKVWRYIGSAIVIILSALVIAWLQQRLGL